MGKSMLKKRLFTSSFLIILTMLAVWIRVFGLIFVSLITILALWEFFSMVEKKGIKVYRYIGIILGLFIPLSIYFKFEFTSGWGLFFVICALFLLFILQLSRINGSEAVLAIPITLFGIFYIAGCFSFILRLRLMEKGIVLVASVLLITKATDIGAYFIGSMFGRHGLIPRLSPKKTIEGAMGGLFFSVVISMLLKNFLMFKYLNLIFLGIILGVLAQVGDLSESLIKRDCNIKDSSHILPGIGGILDVIDSLLVTVPTFYFYYLYFS